VKTVKIWVVVLLIVTPSSLVAAARTRTNMQHALEMKGSKVKETQVTSAV